jgi:Tfp pilus assembly protein PilF
MSDDTASAHELRGSILFDQGRYAEAESYFREALTQEPNDAAVLSKLAICELNQSQPKAALETIQRALALAPEAAHLHALKAFIEVDLHRIHDALASAEAALSLDPECDDAFTARAAAYISRNEWARAETAARAALELNPENAAAANQLAHALRLQNRLQESHAQIAYMLERDPEDADTHVAAGWAALQKGARQQAETHFLEALRLEPGSESAREGLKEAFRAKSPVYRAYLSYCFFMQRFTTGKQWVIIIGLILLVKFARLVLGPFALVVVLPYLLLVLWVHVARPVGNFQLTLDRFARHALDRRETIEAWVCGGGVLLGLPLFLLGVFAGWKMAFIGGATLVGAAFPFAYTFTNVKWGRWLFGAIGALVVVAGVVNIVQACSAVDLKDAATTLSGLAFLGVIGTTWLSNVSALNSRR